jgi:outer membrane protein OmpA-like peptidoglycan-associated protein
MTSVRTFISRIRMRRRTSLLRRVVVLGGVGLAVFAVLFASAPTAKGYSISNTNEISTTTGGGGYVGPANCPTGSVLYQVGSGGNSGLSSLTLPTGVCADLNAAATVHNSVTGALSTSGWGGAFTTRVVAGVPEVSEEVVVLAAPTIAYFNGGTALVKATSKRDIAALTASAKTASSILVTGHSGNIGGERANMVTLSQKRASAVRSLLRGRGVKRTIAIWSFGASFPITNSRSNAQQDLNRRAEIYLIP